MPRTPATSCATPASGGRTWQGSAESSPSKRRRGRSAAGRLHGAGAHMIGQPLVERLGVAQDADHLVLGLLGRQPPLRLPLLPDGEPLEPQQIDAGMVLGVTLG